MQQLFDSLEIAGKTSGIQLAQVVVTVVGGVMLTNLLCNLITRLCERSTRVDASAARFVISVLRLALYLSILIGVMMELGMDPQSLLDQVGLVVAALALALKDDLVSLTNGIRIIVNKPFKQGDHVEVAGVDAVVRSINLFTTELLTYDNQVIRVPNASVAGGTVTNYSKMPTRRVTVVASCAYGADVEEVKRVLHGVVNSTAHVLKNPAPFIRMTNMGASSIDFTVRVWAFTENYVSVLYDLNEGIYKALNAAGLEIPFNQLDVHLRDLPTVHTVRDPAPDAGQSTEGDAPAGEVNADA